MNAILSFYRNQVCLGPQRVLYTELSNQQREHFDKQVLYVHEYTNIQPQNEITIYKRLNSASLYITWGEKLDAARNNKLVQVAIQLLGIPKNKVLVDEALSALLGEPVRRKNDLLVACFLAFNLHFRNKRDPYMSSLKDHFYRTVCGSAALILEHGAPLPPLDAAVAAVAGKLRHALSLYRAATGCQGGRAALTRTGQTDFRRMLICLVAPAEMPHTAPAAGKPERFRRFLELDRPAAAELRGLRDKSQLDRAAVAAMVTAYFAFDSGALKPATRPPSVSHDFLLGNTMFGRTEPGPSDSSPYIFLPCSLAPSSLPPF